MPYIQPLGSPDAPVWILLERPFPTDVPRGFLCSGGMGFSLQKCIEEGGLSLKDVYFICRRPDTDSPLATSSLFDQKIQQYKPPFMIAVGEIAQWLISECAPYNKVTWQTQLNKQVGSLLRSSWPFPHYILPILPIENMMMDYAEWNIAAHLDVGKIREELIYFRKNGVHQPLPQRTLISHEMDTEEILHHLDYLRFNRPEKNYISTDIETIYPRKGSEYHRKHPGLPVVLGLSPSPNWAISFSLWRETHSENVKLWRAVDSLLSEAYLIGQNFFLFDSVFLSALGFPLRKERFADTMLRHHMLWPELSHKLQFMTRQYTREPYYKDEGKTWNMKQLTGLRRYNALDAAVTFEVFEAQEQEFADRPHLKGERVA